MTLSAPLFIVDAFVRPEPFTGNPAAVVLIDGEESARLADSTMQSLAQEMNLSETTYLTPLAGPSPRYRIRWFTPEAEVDLCGHATLAAAHVLYELGRCDRNASIDLETDRAGCLRVSCAEDGCLRLDFPALKSERRAVSSAWERCVLDALGVTDVGAVFHSQDDLIFQLPTWQSVASAKPDFTVLEKLMKSQEGTRWRGVIVTAEGGPGSGNFKPTFCSRFFAPQLGIPEDPVTGSAHCALGPMWEGALGKVSNAEQLSRRGGHVQVSVANGRVELGGRARTVVSGVVSLPSVL